MTRNAVELDRFTARDRELLLAAIPFELPRTSELIERVGESEAILRIREKRESFLFECSDPTIGHWRFDVRGIKDAILAKGLPFRMYRMPSITTEYYECILRNNGVEADRLPLINGPRLECPGIMVDWDGEWFTLIDGNHRLCRRVQLGMNSFRFLIITALSCAPFMCRPGEEHKFFSKPEGTVLESEIRIIGSSNND